MEYSPCYAEKALIYKRFAEVEDAPGKIAAWLKPKLEGKDVLDLGCGTGKYIPIFAPVTNKYYGLDQAHDTLAIARPSIGNLNNVSLIHSSAESIDLPDQAIDVVFAAWVLGTIENSDKRQRVLSECERVLRSKGAIFLIENDLGGEFEILRDRFPNVSRTKIYNDWLTKYGFKAEYQLSTYFSFDSQAEAASVIGSIWGEKAKAYVQSDRIEHRVIVYKLAK